MSRILIVGGAGYIGSHMVKQLTRAGYTVTALDNLSTGHRESARFGELIVGDLADRQQLDQLFTDHNFTAVMHFAAYSLVGESVQHPSKYYRNNATCTLNLLDAMVRHGVDHFIFSSTAAIFGEPEYTPIDEKHPKNPINPYGASKWMVERILADYYNAHGLNSISLRYFNACGADPEGELGELHDPETHLIPLVLQAASGRRADIKIYGDDYPTPDGTCVRDYIHIADLCDAHQRALHHLINGRGVGALGFNLGNGNGFSVKQVVETTKKVVERDQKTITVKTAQRRPGDPATLVADATEAISVLGWQPKYAALETMIIHAWEWEKRQVEAAFSGPKQLTK